MTTHSPYRTRAEEISKYVTGLFCVSGAEPAMQSYLTKAIEALCVQVANEAVEKCAQRLDESGRVMVTENGRTQLERDVWAMVNAYTKSLALSTRALKIPTQE